MLNFTRLHSGYHTATSTLTGDGYVIRTRPLGDGWMAINEYEGIVLATGQTFAAAKEICESYDAAARASYEVC